MFINDLWNGWLMMSYRSITSIMHTIQKQFHTASGQVWKRGRHNKTVFVNCHFCLEELISVDIKMQSNNLIIWLFFSKILIKPKSISLKMVGCPKLEVSLMCLMEQDGLNNAFLIKKNCLELLLSFKVFLNKMLLFTHCQCSFVVKESG